MTSGRLGRRARLLLLALPAVGFVGWAGVSVASPAGPSLSIGDVARVEGDAGNSVFEFTVRLSEPLLSPVKVSYRTADGSATSNSDYNSARGSVEFGAGVTSQAVRVAVRGDTLAEPDEVFRVDLSSPRGASIGDGHAVGKIVNDDAAGLSIDDVTVVEGNAGTVDAVFTVGLSSPAPADVTFDIATADGTAVAGSDYVARALAGQRIPAGSQTVSFAVPVTGDTSSEPDETFLVQLTNPVGAGIVDGAGTGTVTNDDPPPAGPALSVSGPTVTEGDAGTTGATFTVTLSPTSTKRVSVAYASAAGTATSGVDFQPVSGTVTFARGESIKTVVVPVVGDAVTEPDETFLVNLSSPTNAVVAQGQAVGTIDDDDNRAPTAAPAAVTTAEDTPVTVTLAGSDPDGDPITFKIASAPTHGALYDWTVVTGTPLAAGDPVTDPGQRVTYVPAANFEGPADGFTYVTNDTHSDSSPATAQITITPSNDEPTVDAATFDVDEGQAAGTPVGAVTFTDPDASDAHAFAFTAGNDDGAFAVDSTTGAVTVADGSQLDFESTPSYSLTVQVTDDGAGTLSGSNRVTVDVTNVNEAPVVDDATFDVAEGTASGNAVGTVGFTDADAGDAHTFAITAENDDDAFVIDSATGVITVATGAELDFETTPSYSLTVWVTDDGAGTLSGSATITVDVTDVNEAPVVNAATFDVAENTAPGTAIGTVGFTDPDAGDAHSFGITAGNGDGVFVIDPATGAVTVADGAEVDFETTSSYSLTVEVTDAGSRSGSATVTVDVTNVNEAPVHTLPAGQEVVTDTTLTLAGASAISVADVDAGSDDIRVALTAAGGTLTLGTTSGLGFSTGDGTADATVTFTGTLAEVNAALDGLAYAAGAVGSGSIRVVTDDLGNNGTGGAQQDGDTLAIDIVAANGPATDLTLTPGSVVENNTVNTVVGTLANDDDDDGDTFTYTLAAGTGDADNATFTITGDQVSANTSFDFETKDAYKIRVQVADNTGNTYAEALTVTATDVDEAATDITLDPATITENAAPGATVGTLASNDPDTGGTDTFTLVAGEGDADNAAFTVTGDQLAANTAFDFETKATYTVRVQVSDGTHTYAEALTVTVTNVNEAATDLTLTPSRLPENAPAGATVGTLDANDPDTSGTETFTLVTGEGDADNATFTITGDQVTADASFDFETKATYSIRVQVDDGTATFAKSLTVTVTNVNEAPVAAADTTTVSEDGPASAVAVRGNDTDPDGDTLTVTAVDTTGTTGTVTITNAGADVTYDPAANFDALQAGETAKTTFSYTVSDGTLTDTETVTITINGANDAPVADDESFTGANRAIGNTALSVNDPDDAPLSPTYPKKTITGDILAGDSDIDGPGPLTITPGTSATNDGGSVTIEADGDFTFHPAAATSCTDTSDFFDYTLEDSATPELTDTGRVTIEIQDCVWYVDSSFATNGDGRSHSPFNALSGLNGAGGTGDADAAGQRIFLYDSAYAGGLALENSQTLLSERYGLVVPDGAAGTVTLVPATGAGGATTTITGGLTLASGNTIQGIHLGNATGAALSGTGVGTATMNTVTSGTIDNQTGKAVDISNGTLDMAFNAVSSNNSTSDGVRLDNVAGTFNAAAGSIQNAADQDIDITGNNAGDTANITYGGSITDDTGVLVNVSGQNGGTKDFNGAITDGNDGDGSGISLTNNTGATVNLYGGVTLSTGSNAAFLATGGGTVAVTGTANALTTTTGTALNVANTTIGASGLNFRSIAANGAANGIVLNNTGGSGGLTVAGDGTANSGGTIQSTTGDGISLTSTRSPSFNNVRLLNTGGSGVEGTQVVNFTFGNGTINNSGTAGGVGDSNIAFNKSVTFQENNVSGTVTITGNTLANPHYHGVEIFNWAGLLTDVNISGNTLTAKSGGPHSLGSAIGLIARGQNVTSASVTRAHLDNNTVQNGWQGSGIQAQGGHVGTAPAVTFGTPGSATDVISISGNTLTATATDPFNAEGIIALQNHAGQANFRVNNNGTAANPIGKTKGTAISNSAFGNVRVTSEIKGNYMAPDNIFASQGIGVGTSSSISPTSGGNVQTPDFTVAIENNVVSQTDGAGILAVAGDASSLLKLAIRGNDVGARASSGGQSIVVRAGNSNGDNDVCLDISGNKSAPPVGAPQFLGIGLRKQGTSPTVNAFGIEGMTATSSPGVENYVNGLNPNGSGTLLVSATSGFTNCSSAP